MKSGSKVRSGKRLSFLLVAGAIAAIISCDAKPPSRDYIPVLRQRLFELQQAIAAKNRYALDSLSSLQSLNTGHTSDSLLSFIYGPNGDRKFKGLVNYEIFYTDDKARIDSDVADSTSGNVPITLTFVREHNMWLLKRFDLRVDSIQ